MGLTVPQTTKTKLVTKVITGIFIYHIYNIESLIFKCQYIVENEIRDTKRDLALITRRSA